MSAKPSLKSKLAFVLFSFTASTLWPAAVSASDGDRLWDEDGIRLGPVLTENIILWDAVQDGSGGAYWFVYRGDEFFRYAEFSHTTHDGAPDTLWTLSPVETLPSIAADGRGGAIYTWATGNIVDGYTIRAQRIESGGIAHWGPEPSGFGIAVSTPFDASLDILQLPDVWPKVASDGIGGAYISWTDRLAYVEAQGTLPAPGLDGIKLIPENNPPGYRRSGDFHIVSDGTGGANPFPPPLELPGGIYAAWREADLNDVIAQHVKSGLEWGDDGLPIDPAGVFVEAIANDGAGGMLLAWMRQTPTENPLLIQRLNASGDELWTSGGIELHSFAELFRTRIMPDGNGGAYVSWADEPNNFLQHVDANGGFLWPDPVWIGTDLYPLAVASDGAGGILLTYSTHGEFSRDIAVARFNPDGYRLFSRWVRRDGASVGDPGLDQIVPKIAFDNMGPQPHGAVIVWADRGPGPTVIQNAYAQKIEIVDHEVPVNDTCATAILVTTGDYTGTLIEATNDGSVNCVADSDEPDVWYSFTADLDGILTATTCGTNDRGRIDGDMNTVVSLHAGCTGTGANELACNDDWHLSSVPDACAAMDQGDQHDSAVTRFMLAGERLLIRVSRAGNTIGGHFSLHVGFVGDTDGDGHLDDVDNCQLFMNGGQIDTDRDGIGNICDADFSDDCAINFIDLNIMKQQFFTTDASPDWDPDVDLNHDGAVNFVDLQVMKLLFFGRPGPSGRPNICEEGCGLRDTGLDPAQHFGVEMFVRGSFNGWGFGPPYNLINFGDGVYRMQVEVDAAQHELKIAPEPWTYEYDGPESVLLGVPLLLDGGQPDGSPNISLDLSDTGCYNFRAEVVDAGTPPARIELTINRKP